MLKSYEQELIEGLTEEEARRLIKSVNGINRTIGLKKFGER